MAAITKKRAKTLIVEAFENGGYCRVRDPFRQAEEGQRVYKKGYEVRLPVRTKREARTLAAALKAWGIHSGKPFAKSRSFILPVYGKKQMGIVFQILQGPRS
jgi:hypothetical protein